MLNITLNRQKKSLAINKTTEKNDDPTAASNEAIKKVISRFQKENLLSKSISEELKAENIETLQFYQKPKKNNIKRVIRDTHDMLHELSYFKRF